MVFGSGRGVLSPQRIAVKGRTVKGRNHFRREHILAKHAAKGFGKGKPLGFAADREGCDSLPRLFNGQLGSKGGQNDQLLNKMKAKCDYF